MADSAMPLGEESVGHDSVDYGEDDAVPGTPSVLTGLPQPSAPPVLLQRKTPPPEVSSKVESTLIDGDAEVPTPDVPELGKTEVAGSDIGESEMGEHDTEEASRRRT